MLRRLWATSATITNFWPFGGWYSWIMRWNPTVSRSVRLSLVKFGSDSVPRCINIKGFMACWWSDGCMLCFPISQERTWFMWWIPTLLAGGVACVRTNQDQYHKDGFPHLRWEIFYPGLPPLDVACSVWFVTFVAFITAISQKSALNTIASVSRTPVLDPDTKA